MSLATALEYIDNEKLSMETDEALDFLIQLRDAIEKRIERLRMVERVGRAHEFLSESSNDTLK